MPRGRKSDQQRGRPKAGNTKYGRNGNHTQSADEHGPFPGGVHREVTPDESGREPSAGDAPEVGDDIDNEDGQPDLRQMQAVFSLQIVGNPEEIKPPNGIDHEFSSRKRPGLPVRQKLRPFYFHGLPDGITLDVLSFATRAGGMLFRLSIQKQPKNQPGKTKNAGQQECPAPTEMVSNRWDDEWRNDCPDTGASVEDSGGQGALFLGEPFGDAFDASREDSGFAESQGKAGCDKTGKRKSQRMDHRSQAPKDHGDRVTNARAQAVDQSANKNHTDRICRLKGKHQMAVGDVVPPELVL